MKRVPYVAFLAAILVLAGCAAFGVPSPKSFSEKLATGYSNVTTLRQTTTILLNNRVITAKDAQNIQNNANTVRDGLDVARDLYAVRPQDGVDRLEVALVSLQALQRYVDRKSKEVNP